MTPTFETVLFTVADDHVATITLNRPEVLNAFNQQMCAEFATLWSIIREEDAIHAVVLRAAGDLAFSTGVDVKAPLRYSANVWSQADPGDWLSPKGNRVWKPVVCAVHGMAAGGAFYWINESDIVICSPEATFFDPHVTHGLTAVLACGRPGYGPCHLGVAGHGAERGARARHGLHADWEPALGRLG